MLIPSRYRPSHRLALSALGIAHRRGGYRDPESEAFIESWFRYLKERCVWRQEFETLDQAREVIAAYIDHYLTANEHIIAPTSIT